MSMGIFSRSCLVLVLIWAWGGSLAVGQTGRSTVYIEDSPAVQELFDEAQSLRRQDRLTDAAERLQQVIEDYPDKLTALEEEHLYEDALLQAHRKLLDDRRLREAYRSRYHATAQRRLDAALEAGPDGEALERVSRQYAMTEPGFESALLLAGWYLERADGRSASGVLDSFELHPDRAAHGERYDLLQAMAGLLAGEQARLERYRTALSDEDETDALAQLEALAERLQAPLRLEAFEQAVADVGDLPELLRRPLWETEVSFTGTPGDPTDGIRELGGRGPRPSGREGEAHPPVLPTAGDQRLYINEGNQLRALDRHSGWTLWRFDWEPDAMLISGMAQIGRIGGDGADPQPVLLAGRSAFAVMGHSSFWPARWERETAPTVLVAVDRNSGELAWKVEPGDLDRAFERSNFQGTLLAGDDTVFALVRRSQASGFQDTFLVAVDQRDGSLRWRRHLSSAATTSRFATGPRPEMAAAGSTIYVSDNVGTVSAVDARHGTVRWARVFMPDPRMLERGVLPGGMAASERIGGAPILTGAGLIVPSPAMEGRKVFVFDPATGQVVDEQSDEAWRQADHLLPTGDGVLAVGRTLVLFDGTTLEARWSHQLAEQQRTRIAGRAAISRKYVLVPTHEQVVLLERETGEVVRRLDVEESGNVLAYDGQFVIATNASLRSYLDWRRAASHLRRQIQASEGDPGAGLALAHLAMRAEQPGVAMEGVDAALEALRHPDLRSRPDDHRNRQAEVFDKLHDLTGAAQETTPGLRGELFDRMATITTGPMQEVTYHLAVANYHAEVDQPRQAVEHLQAVLLDETLSGQLYEQPQVARQAGLEARRRLTDLVEREGRDIYASFDALAERQLQQLRQRGARAESLARVAEQYPLARAVPEALREAGRRHADADALPAAARQFRRAYEHALRESPELLPEIVGELAELYEQRERPRQAAVWLERVRQQQPNLEPLRNGEPTPLSSWITDLSDREELAGDRPRLALPFQQPRVLAGRPLPPVAATAGEQARDRVVTLDGGTLRLYVGPSLEAAWQQTLPDEPAVALSVTDAQVLLWLERSRALVALDGETGEALWEPVEAAKVLDEVGDARQRDAARPREQRDFIEMIEVGPVRVDGRLEVQRARGDRDAMFRVVGDQVIVLADGHGRVVGIDRDTGRVQWTRLAPMDELSAVTSNADTVALAGVSGLGTDAVGGTLLVLDLLSGEPRFPAIEDNDLPQWVGFAGDNLVTMATVDGVAAYQLGTGEPAWRLRLGENASPLTGRGWADHHLLLLLDNANMALAIEASSGQLLNRVSVAGGMGVSRVEAEAVVPNWHLLTPTNLIAVDGRGQVAWRDAVSATRKQFVHHLASRDHAVVVHREAEGHAPPGDLEARLDIRMQAQGEQVEPNRPARADGDGGARYRLFMIERRTGRLVAERPLGPLPHTLDEGPAMLLDNQIIFTLGNRTLVLPGAAAEADPEAEAAPDAGGGAEQPPS